MGDLGENPGMGRSPGEGKGYLFQYSGLENSTDCIVGEQTINKIYKHSQILMMTSLSGDLQTTYFLLFEWVSTNGYLLIRKVNISSFVIHCILCLFIF